jgi:mRNA interferase MazF
VTFERFSVVIVPFPFTDGAATRRRPAVVISAPETLGRGVGHNVLAMVTSAANPSWPLDVPIADLQTAGLPQPSVVRMKLFTLDDRFVLRVAGRLAPDDCVSVERSLARLFARPHVIPADVGAAYAAMAADEVRERDALEWAEATIGDVADPHGNDETG